MPSNSHTCAPARPKRAARSRKPDVVDSVVRSMRNAGKIFFEQLWNVLRFDDDTAIYIAENARVALHGLRLGAPGYVPEDVSTSAQRKKLADLRAELEMAYECAGNAVDAARARKWGRS